MHRSPGCATGRAIYLKVAGCLAGSVGRPDDLDLRVFPGLSLLLVPASAAGLPLEYVALALVWLCAACVAPLVSIWSGRSSLGWTAACFTPSWLMYSTMVLSEPPLVVASLGGLIAARRGRPVLAGLALGFAGLFRPMACFAALAACAGLAIDGRRRDALTIGLISATVVAAVSVALSAGYGYGLGEAGSYSAKYYGGDLFALPFESLALATLAETPTWKVAYIWAHVVLVLTGLLLSTSRRKRGLEMESLLWLSGNTLFVLCIGDVWGFHEFHRFILPALPALLLALVAPIERFGGKLVWSATAVLSFLLALYGFLPH